MSEECVVREHWLLQEKKSQTVNSWKPVLCLIKLCVLHVPSLQLKSDVCTITLEIIMRSQNL